MRTISLTALRRLAIAAQGYATHLRTGTRREVDELVAAGVLHLEPGFRRSGALDDAFERALDRLRRVIGLERVIR